jgi:hypothetical protein
MAVPFPEINGNSCLGAMLLIAVQLISVIDEVKVVYFFDNALSY